MSGENKVKSLGRIKYIEPTNLTKEDGGFNVSGEKISFPYEDYCMSVDLTVRVTNRYSCGWGNENGMVKEFNYSSSNNSISFLGGTKVNENSDEGFLTTKFTDISMTNPNTNTSECLGIETITINYDGRLLYPLVTIRFIDVRGASVMQPLESGYYNNSDKGNSRFLYKSLFTMPYPMFILKVKGFYGKGVTFKLSPFKTELEFDSQSGNFIINVSFTGYMYGIYTDLPMTFIAAAPYTDVGALYWKEKVNSGDFKFKDAYGIPRYDMLKIPELRQRVAEAAKNEEAISAASEGEKITKDKDAQIDSLRNIGDLYPFKKWFIYGDFKCKVIPQDKFEDFMMELQSYGEMIKTYDKHFNTNYSVFFSEIIVKENKEKKYDGKEFLQKIGGTRINYLFPSNLTPKNEVIFKGGLASEFTHNRLVANTKIDEYRQEEALKIGVNYVLILLTNENNEPQKSFLKELSKNISLISEEKKQVERKYKLKEMELIEKLIGFRPSIRNIYDLIFAHIDTFMHCFYYSTKMIREQLESGDDKRSKKYYGVTSEDATDTERYSIGGGGENKLNNFLPPFVAFYKDVSDSTLNTSATTINSRKEFVWPGEISEKAEELEEVKFINDLLYGSEQFTDESSDVEDYINSLSSGNSGSDTSSLLPYTKLNNFIPITIYDYVYKNNMDNPYINVKRFMDNNKNSDITGVIMGIFALRAFYYFSTTQKSKGKNFGKIEAINFYKALGDNTSEQFFNFIKTYSKKYSGNKERKFIEVITSTNSNNLTKLWNVNGEQRLFKVNGADRVYYSLSGDGEKMFPLGIFNFNDIIANYTKKNISFDDERFINLITPRMEDENYSRSFALFETRDYINTIHNCIKNEISSKIGENVGFGNRKSDEYQNDTFSSIIDEETYEGSVKDLLVEETFLDGKTIFDFNGNPIGKNKCKEIINEYTFSQKLDYWIKYPTKVDEEKNTSLFNIPTKKDYSFYFEQTDIYAKAYLFLAALPIRNVGKSGNIVSSHKNGLIPKSLLLREGSYYWYLENSDKLKSNYYKTPGPQESFISDLFIENYETMSPSTSNSYVRWYYPLGCTPSRKEILKKYFIDWVEDNKNGFGKYESYLTNKNHYTNLNYNEGLSLEVLNGKNSITETARELQEFLRDLFFNLCTIFDLYNNNLQGVELSCKKNDLMDAFDGFMEGLYAIYGDLIKESDGNNNFMNILIEYGKNKSPFNNKDIKASTYMTLKSLYDKWLCAPEYGPLETWSLTNKNNIRSVFKNFVYVDSYYHDIGDLFTINISKLSNWLSSCLPTSNINSEDDLLKYRSKSVYEFLTEVAQSNGAMLMALPQKFGHFNIEDMKGMFKPLSLYEDWNKDETSFVFMYTYKPSEHLENTENSDMDMNGFSQKGDGIDLTDDDIVGSIFGDDGKTIPAFGVTYAKQNQAFFKDIKLSSVSHAATEAGIAGTMNVASKASESPRESQLYGQDIYKILSNNSYHCGVEMLGNMQIMPLMYFQLNNVPLWRGAYMIQKVSHNISAGKFETKFEGVRVNRHSIPLSNGTAFTLISPDKEERSKKTISLSQENINGENNILQENTISPIEEEINKERYTPNKVSDIIDFNEKNITKEKPLICITPAHGPNTQKRLEWIWSSKVVDRIIDIIKTYTYEDGTPYNIQRCNKNGNHTTLKGYSMFETKELVKKYGGEQVISVVPHWNGGGGQRYEIYLNREGKVRSDSKKFAECMKSEVEKVVKLVSGCGISINENTIIEGDGITKLENAITPTINIKTLPPNNSDGAPQQNCACILTENWYADYSGDGKGVDKWKLGKTKNLLYNWLMSEKTTTESEEDLKSGIETIAQMHAKAIKRYIDSLS